MTSKMRAKDTKLKNHSLRLFSIGANNPKYLRELLSSAQYGNFCLTLIKGNIDERNTDQLLPVHSLPPSPQGIEFTT